MIRVSIDANAGASFARFMERHVDFVIERTARQVAARAQQIAAQMADSTYDTRAPERRGNVGSTHAAPSNARYKAGFRGTVSGRGSRTTVILSNRAQHAHILEHGSAPHEIRGNPLLAIPSADLLASGSRVLNAFGRPTSRRTGEKQRNTVLPRVSHPGTQGSHIMEKAMRQAWAEQGVRLGPMR